jgi:hypothetical protein
LGNANTIFYDDGRAGQGLRDYALITDFARRFDIIQLKGSADKYLIKPVPIRGFRAKDLGIFLNKPGNKPDELLAVVVGAESLGLNRPFFEYV